MLKDLSLTKIRLIPILFFLYSFSYSQNLVNNNNFDDVIDPVGCHSWYSAFLFPNSSWGIINWYSPIDDTSSTTYGGGWLSHACMEPMLQSAYRQAKPCNYPMPCPKEGIGYAMISIRKQAPLSQNILHRGYIAQKLQDTLKAGVEYTIEFYARPFKWSNAFSKNLGVRLTSDSLVFTSYLQNVGPHIETQYAITDTTSWTRVIGTYVANGTERFFNIGNFWHDTATVLIPSGFTSDAWFTPLQMPYYLIDAIYLYKSTDTLLTATLPNDTLLCPNEQLALQPLLNGFMLEDTTTTYLWSTGSTDSTITVTQPGTYWVQTTINSRFVAGDTIVVDYFPPNYTLSLPDTVTFCEGTEAVIQATTLPSQYSILTVYLWNTGSTLTGIQVRNRGLYYLNAQTPCYNLADSTWALQDFCESYLWVPNAFTPDGDGTNDYFAFQGAPAPVKLSIYDRWGKRVFYSDNYQNNWDGSYQGQDLPVGVYTYLIEYLYINPNATQPDPKGSERQVRGTVTIIR